MQLALLLSLVLSVLDGLVNGILEPEPNKFACFRLLLIVMVEFLGAVVDKRLVGVVSSGFDYPFDDAPEILSLLRNLLNI